MSSPTLARALLVASMAATLLSGCFSHPVTLAVAAESPGANCFEACASAFGAKPTLNCGERARAAASPILLCAYQNWPAPASASAQPAGDAACRAARAEAGNERVEACWSLTTQRGATAVACRYAVGAH